MTTFGDAKQFAKDTKLHINSYLCMCIALNYIHQTRRAGAIAVPFMVTTTPADLTTFHDSQQSLSYASTILSSKSKVANMYSAKTTN